jgi:hypothetical protein
MPLRKIRNPKSFDKCRTCKHSYVSHTDIIHNPSVCQYVVNGSCRCKEFLPKDNLEFLEYKYAKRK